MNKTDVFIASQLKCKDPETTVWSKAAYDSRSRLTTGHLPRPWVCLTAELFQFL